MGIDADATMKTADFGVFIDVMSLYQPDLDTDTSPTSVLDTAKLAYTHDTHKKPEEQASFDRAIHNVGLLYGHKNTAVLRLTQTPVPPVGDPDRLASGEAGRTSSAASATSKSLGSTASTWRIGRRPWRSAPPGCLFAATC